MALDEIEFDTKIAPMQNEPAPKAEPKQTEPGIDAATRAISETDQPGPRDQIDKERFSEEIPPIAEDVKKAVRSAFPDPVREGLMAAIRKEELTASQIAQQEKKANECMQKIDQLLDLTAELSALPDTDTIDFTDKIRTILTDLKSQGTDLWKDENTNQIAKEKVAELKSLISTHTDKSRTQQTLILTKMQSLAQDLMAILESAKGMQREDSRGKSTMIRNQRVSA